MYSAQTFLLLLLIQRHFKLHKDLSAATLAHRALEYIEQTYVGAADEAKS